MKGYGSSRGTLHARWSVFWVLTALFALASLLVLFAQRHGLQTGFHQRIVDLKPNQNYQPAKTLWDWLQLAGVPAVLAVIAYLFQDATKRSEQRISLENQRNDILQKYLDAMSELFLSDKWSTALVEFQQTGKRTTAQTLARARTQTALSALQSEPPDRRRRGQIIRFLVENQFLQRAKAASPATIDLSGTDLRGIDLARADLSHVDLSGIDLTGADLRWANLWGTLEDVVNSENRYRESKPYTTKFDPKWQLVSDIVRTSRVGRDLRRKDFRNAFLGKADLAQADLRNADFRGAILTGASLFQCDLRGANFKGAVLDRADLLGTKADWLTRFDPKWKMVWQILCQSERDDAFMRRVRNADLAHAHLFYARLGGMVFERADLSEANLEGAFLEGAKFGPETKLLGADFTDSHLRGCYLNDCNIGLCSLQSAKLAKASLIKANLSLSKLDRADLTEANLNGSQLWNVSMTGANLTDAIFTNASIKSTDFTNADLTRVDLTGAVFEDANFAGAILRDAKISREQLATISNLNGAVLPDGARHA